MEEVLAAGDGDHGGAALFDGIEALFGGELLFEDVGGVLDLAAAGAGEVAAEEGFEHEDQGVLAAAGELLPQDVAGDGPHLGDGDGHCWFRAPKKDFTAETQRTRRKGSIP